MSSESHANGVRVPLSAARLRLRGLWCCGALVPPPLGVPEPQGGEGVGFVCAPRDRGGPWFPVVLAIVSSASRSSEWANGSLENARSETPCFIAQ